MILNVLGQELKRFNYFFYFKKVLISFGLFGFLSPLEASTFDLICSPARSFLITYEDKVSSDKGVLTKNRSKYKDNTKSAEKFKVSYDLKNNNAFIEGKPAKAIRISDPKPFEYAPLFLYSTGNNLSENEISNVDEDGDILSSKTITTLIENKWSIRLDRPTDSSGPFYAIKSFKESEETSRIDFVDEVSVDTLVEDTVLEISEGYCKE